MRASRRGGLIRALLLLSLGAAGPVVAQSGGLLCAGRDIVSRTVTPGGSSDVVLSGDLAYIADTDAGLLILDISNPASPVALGSVDTPGYARALWLAGSYAYIADDASGLQVVDVSDPMAPALVGSLGTATPVFDVFVSEGAAYLAADTGGLVIADVTDPAVPVALGAFDTPELARSVVVEGELAYLADYLGGLLIFDVSDPASPLLIGSWDDASVRDVKLAGGLLYAASGIGLAVFDVSSPGSPQLLGSNDAAVGWDITIAGGRAYMRGAHSVFDISDPSDPVVLGSFAHLGYRSVIRDGLAFVAEFDTLLVVDVSDPPGSGVLGRLAPEDLMEGLAVQGDYAYVADWTGGMGVIDISNSSDPVRVASVPPTTFAHDLAVQGNYAYVVEPGAGLTVVDISVPTDPVIVVAPTSFRGARVAVDGGFAGVLSSSRLYLIDISDPLAPAELASHSGYGGQRQHGRVCLRDGFAYVAAPGFTIFDLSRPAEPAIAEVATPSSATAVDVQGDLALVGCSSHLVCYDISDRTDPQELASLPLPNAGIAEAIRLVDNLAFVGLTNGDLWVIDITNPSAPKPWLSAEGWLAAQDIWGVEVRGDSAYVIDSLHGLTILDISDCPPCPGDFNGDGGADSRDVIGFLNVWVAERGTDCSGGCETDMNGDGTVDTRDFVVFLNLWAAGC